MLAFPSGVRLQNINSVAVTRIVSSSSRCVYSCSIMYLATRLKLSFVKCVIFIYDVVTLPVYFLVQQPWKVWKANRTIWAKQIREDDPYSACVRVIRSGKNLLEGISTLDELFRTSVARHGSNKCMGAREVLDEAHEYCENGKGLKKVHLGEYQWFSYLDVDKRVENLSKGMLELGLQPKKQVIIFAETRIEWMLLCQACFRINVPVATLYSTLGDNGIIHGINETEVSFIFTSQELLGKLKNILDKTPLVKTIVYMENIRPADTSGFSGRVSVLPLSQLENIGANSNSVQKPDPPTTDDLAVIMYTSGSTGIPKGVLLTHKNVITTARGLSDGSPSITPAEVYIAYLPLAHVYEITIECFFFITGVRVGYSSPYTLTDKSTAIMSGCKGDATLLKPTVITAVPLMLDRIRKAVDEEIGTKSPFAQEFFKFAVQYKLFWYRKGFGTPILNRLVFQKIRNLVGGKVSMMTCGGAPLSPDTHDFIRVTLNVRMFQGYGMTETAGTATVMALDDISTGRVGAPLRSCYIRLADWEEGNYYPTDQPYPRGELVIGGDCITLGYFKNEALTKECITEEDGVRWLYTGDIGELHPDGTFKIIDRKKDLVKLQCGEYISLGKVESELKTCALIDNICVNGNGLNNYLVALVVPNPKQLKSLAVRLGKEDLPIQELCQDPTVISAFLKAIVEQGQRSKLMRAEIPTKIKLCSEEWTPETGLVTAALKIRRKMVEQFYKTSIDEMYNPELNGTAKST